GKVAISRRTCARRSAACRFPLLSIVLGVSGKQCCLHPNLLTFPLCCFDQIVCWCPRDTPCKCININGFRTCYSQLLSLVEPRTRAQSPKIWAYKGLRIKHFHGVSSRNQHSYLLKSRNGKVTH